jgi:hypothetical protein
MNPTRTLGPALASNDFKGLWVYIIRVEKGLITKLQLHWTI